MLDANLDSEPDEAIDEAVSFDPSDFMPALQPKPGGLGMLRLRDYQTEAVDCIYEAWQSNNAVLAVLATGLGKTVIAAEVVIRWPGTKRILFIAHVKELIDQAQERIGHHTDDAVSVEMGPRKDNEGSFGPPSRVLAASIQTLSRRMQKFKPTDFDLVIIDEFHHAAANSYRRLWDWLNTGNPQAKLLGITATPNRADNLTLGCIAETCAYQMDIRDGIDSGWLVPIKQQYIVVEDLDFSHCRTLAKDINEHDLEIAMLGGEESDDMTPEERAELLAKQERMMHAIAAPAVRESQGRPGIVYCVTVNHATRMAEVFRRYPGVTAQVITGKTNDKERAEMIADFKGGRLQFLVNVGVATEGFDVPGAHLIVMARPTKSKTLYTQMVGRGTRPVAGMIDRYDTPELRQEAIANSVKPFMTVLDFCGNSGKHKLVSTADVLAGDMPAEFVAAAIADMKKTGAAEDIRAAAWQKKQEHDEAVAKRQEEERQRKKQLRQELVAREEARRARIHAQAKYRTQSVDPFDTRDVVAGQTQSTFRGGSTDAQIGALVKFGIRRETAMKWTKKQAGAVISDYRGRSGGEYVMPFGKHAGKPLKEIPHDYLRWGAENLQCESFQKNIAIYREEYRRGRQ